VVHPTPYTLNHAPYTIHPAPYTVHPTPYQFGLPEDGEVVPDLHEDVVSLVPSVLTILLYRNVQWFRGGLVFKAHRLLYHSTPGLRVIKKKTGLTSLAFQRTAGWFQIFMRMWYAVNTPVIPHCLDLGLRVSCLGFRVSGLLSAQS